MINFKWKLSNATKSNKITKRCVGGGGNVHNKIVKNLLSLGASASMMLAMVPNNGAFAAEPTTFVTTAFANHWGRSDLRAYLNNGLAATVAEDGFVSE